MPHRPPDPIPGAHRPPAPAPAPAPDPNLVALPAVSPELQLRRDQAVAALALRKRLTLQGAADELADIMKHVDTATHRIIHGPGPTVPGPSTETPR
jgi:hypothetical protein